MPTDNNNNEKPSILKDARETKGLTLDIVHEATKIPMDALKAIEEGYSSRILSPFYYRGFIKIYAEFLGLDVKETYKNYGLTEPLKPVTPAASTAIKPSAPPSRREPKPQEPNLFLETIGAGVQESLAFLLKPRTLMFIARTIAFLVLIFLLVKMVGCAASHLHHRPTHPHQQSVDATPPENISPAESAPAAPVTAVAPPEIKHQVVEAQSQNDQVEVAVRAVKDTWLRVKADDKIVFETTLTKGSLETWTADRHIEISGRDIEQLDMEVNNKHLGFLGGGEHRIRRVIITQEGLTVKR